MTKQEKTEIVAEELQACTSITSKIPDMEAISDIDMLSSMLSIYSPSGCEHPMIAYVTQYLKQNKIDYEIDTAGNIYFSNDVEGDKRILLNAHMDTVGSAAPDIVVEKVEGKGTVLYSSNNQVIGGDDKCGVFAVLRIISNKAIDTPLSGLLTVSEETGCIGARHAMDNHADKFSDIVFNITIDRNGNTDIITQNSDYKLCSDEMDVILAEWGKDFSLDTTSGSISDVSEIVSTLDINGINLFAGYYNAHTGKEHIIMEHLYESIAFTKFILPKLHKHFTDNPDFVKFEATRAYSNYTYGRGAYSWDNYEDYAGIKYYGGSKGWTKTLEAADTSEDKLIAFLDALDRIEGEEGQYAGLDRLAEEDNIRISGSGKSVVIPDAFVNYYVEMDILEDYLPVAQNGYDGVISVSDIKTYIKGWNVLEDGEEFEA
jgi:acetylornithine deacetylase/succinyl-diaminopimelate desuccinylase-like protein